MLRVIARLNVGGPARHVASLAALDRRGFETLLVHGSVDAGEASMADLVAGTGVRMTAVPELGRRIHWRSDAVALSRLMRICREFRPHIIHTHTAKAGSLGRVMAALSKATGRRVSIVHTFHGHVFEGYFGRAGSAAARWAERALAALSDRIVVISDRQKHDIVTRFRIAPAHKVRVIPLGLDLQPFAAVGDPRALRLELGAASDETLIGIVGRLAPIKHHELFLRAGAAAAGRGLKPRLVIAGGGEREGALRSLASDLGIASKVHFLGWRHDLANLYAGLDIVTLTSRNEGTPVALIEAMAAGRPVVSTAVGGVEDVVRPEETGVLVGADDADELASAWIRLAREPALGQALGARARADVMRRFSSARLVEDIDALYRELLREHLRE